MSWTECSQLQRNTKGNPHGVEPTLLVISFSLLSRPARDRHSLSGFFSFYFSFKKKLSFTCSAGQCAYRRQMVVAATRNENEKMNVRRNMKEKVSYERSECVKMNDRSPGTSEWKVESVGVVALTWIFNLSATSSLIQGKLLSANYIQDSFRKNW